MLDELLVLLAVLAGTAWIAVGAFARPEGVYWKSAAGLVAAVLAAAGLWQAASPVIANEAGLGGLVVFLMLTVLAAFVAIVAVAAATARHVWNALLSRNA